MLQSVEPADDIGEHCFSPYFCGFFGHCTKHLPTPNVFDVAGARTNTKLKCYNKGIISFEDLNTCGVFSSSQYKRIEHELFDYPSYIGMDSIRGFMKNLSYPLYFLDFESFQPAVPLFDNSRPYEKIVFQYLVHYVEHEGGELKHTEFLTYPGGDPRRALAEQLCADIPLDVCTTAYNMGFEKGRIRGLAELYPDLRDHLMNIHDRIQDLMIPFQKSGITAVICRDHIQSNTFFPFCSLMILRLIIIILTGFITAVKPQKCLQKWQPCNRKNSKQQEDSC